MSNKIRNTNIIPGNWRSDQPTRVKLIYANIVKFKQTTHDSYIMIAGCPNYLQIIGGVMLLKKCVVVALAGLSLASTVTSAAVINFQFTGTVTYGGSLAVAGDQISGSFSLIS